MGFSSHDNPGIDFHLKALGFTDRHHLRIVAHDNKLFRVGKLVVKPDWVIQNIQDDLFYTIDYKSRASNGRVSDYERWQAAIFSAVTAGHLEAELERPIRMRCGILYANDCRVDIQVEQPDVDIMHATMPAAMEYCRQKGTLLNGCINGSQLAEAIAFPDRVKPESDPVKVARGNAAHASLREFSPVNRKLN